MKYILVFLFASFALAPRLVVAQADEIDSNIPRTNLTPLMERYILDELKALRTDLEHTRAELIEKVAQSELETAGRAIDYSSNTITFFFYIITGAGIMLALVGWNSLRDIRRHTAEIAEKQIRKLVGEYERRLTDVEDEIREEGKNIIKNQQEIEKTQEVHFLWWKAELEKDSHKRLKLYDNILNLEPEAVEALNKKSEIHLNLEEYAEAVEDINVAIRLAPDNSNAYYNRARAYAQMHNIEAALTDLAKAFKLIVKV